MVSSGGPSAAHGLHRTTAPRPSPPIQRMTTRYNGCVYGLVSNGKVRHRWCESQAPTPEHPRKAGNSSLIHSTQGGMGLNSPAPRCAGRAFVPPAPRRWLGASASGGRRLTPAPPSPATRVRSVRTRTCGSRAHDASNPAVPTSKARCRLHLRSRAFPAFFGWGRKWGNSAYPTPFSLTFRASGRRNPSPIVRLSDMKATADRA